MAQTDMPTVAAKVRPAEITVAHLDSQPASASHSFTNEANISREQQTGPNLTLQVSQLKFVENYKEDDGFVVLPYGQVDKLARTLSISEVQQNSASPDKSDLTAKNNSKVMQCHTIYWTYYFLLGFSTGYLPADAKYIYRLVFGISLESIG